MAFGTDVGQRHAHFVDHRHRLDDGTVADLRRVDKRRDDLHLRRRARLSRADRMWEFCAKHKVEILGISPTLVRALANCGDDLPKKHDLSSLRAFASTGEPWNPAPWWWLFEKVGDSKLPIINYSGGTEISGGILMNNPLCRSNRAVSRAVSGN
jgi:acyl-coenzyme A synthetase/AMP-(fatty) acid ligase